MEQLLPYIVKSVLVSGVLTAYYLIALRNRRFHGYNRVYLLSVLVVSLLLPLVRIDWQPFAGIGWQPFSRVGGTPLGSFARQTGPTDIGTGGSTWFTLLLNVAVVVSLASVGLLTWRLLQVYRLRRHQALHQMAGYTLVETDDPRAPFSFFSTLFWKQGAGLADPVNQKILNHELAHIRGMHSWDGLFARLVNCVFWMNPFFWLIRKELTMVHEFIADAATGMEGDAQGFARMLLQSIYAGQLLEPVHAFFQSPIKRRLMMINQNRAGGLALGRKTFVLPVLTAVVLVVSCSKTQTPAAKDAADQAKLLKEQLDLKIKRLVLSGVFKYKHLQLMLLPDSGKTHLEKPLILRPE
jgi:BlaR1 peptidase M56